MQFYIGSSFANITNVRTLRDKLIDRGFTLTYDWTQNERATSKAALQTIGHAEKQAITLSDCVIILLPAGKGSHIELGIALGQDKPIFLHCVDQTYDRFETTSTFYHLPEIIPCSGTLEELTELIVHHHQQMFTRGL
ncbi:nucleoside 2-deoxyribosyltransferase [Exiguobacterium sp. s80]|uniref:nucleoside 2-deoxyribosyltransferase n=1 Tax=Exiguobacterium sp. s80 TaxID=2751209 RepID=UPI001BE8AF43|nr:nucleoside 2-deoxyribosyltransferase [Exiguobacterium sp. s80]